MRLYLAGPMRDYAHFNFPAFDEAAAKLRAEGHDIVSPAERDREVWPAVELAPGFDVGKFEDLDGAPEGYDFRSLMLWDIEQIAFADGIALLPRWRQSTGASLEFSVARAFQKNIYRYDPNETGLLHVVESPS